MNGKGPFLTSYENTPSDITFIASGWTPHCIVFLSRHRGYIDYNRTLVTINHFYLHGRRALFVHETKGHPLIEARLCQWSALFFERHEYYVVITDKDCVSVHWLNVNGQITVESSLRSVISYEINLKVIFHYFQWCTDPTGKMLGTCIANPFHRNMYLTLVHGPGTVPIAPIFVTNLSCPKIYILNRN